jgi:hypothetical protein
MKINDLDKAHISFLLQTGDKLGAVRYLQQAYSMTAEEALTLAEKLEQQDTITHPSASERNNPLRLVGIIFTVAGFLLLSAGFIFGFRDFKFTANAIPISGKVVSISPPPGYQPVIEYTMTGSTYTVTGEKLSSDRVFVVGQDVELLVDPGKPQDAKLNSFFDRWFLVAMLASIGLLFSIIGFAVRKMTTSDLSNR